MKLSDLFDMNDFYAELSQGYIRIGIHPRFALHVYCYTEKTVLEQRWNDVTRRCRGLVVGPNEEIVAYCMPKFFNASEHSNGNAYAPVLPTSPFKVYAKADGSLGTVFHYNGAWQVATKGSFTSDQAKTAQQWLDDMDLTGLPPDNTYVAEIIYPENRIVVDYGKETTLKLLTVFGPDGRERDLNFYGPAWELIGGTVIQRYPDAKLSTLLFRAQRNQRVDGRPVTGTEAEGYVLHFQTGERAKVKFADYVRLHGIVTGLTERHVWELLRDGRSLSDLLDVLPDEHIEWLNTTADRLRRQFRQGACTLLMELAHSGLPDDPRHFSTYAFSDKGGSLRAVYDVLREQTWNSLKPAATGPWKGDF